MSDDVKMVGVTIHPIPDDMAEVIFEVHLRPAPDRNWVAAFDEVMAENLQWAGKGFSVSETGLNVTIPENAFPGVKTNYLNPLIANVNIKARTRRGADDARAQKLKALADGYNQALFP
jgi:hypothetical protein